MGVTTGARWSLGGLIVFRKIDRNSRPFGRTVHGRWSDRPKKLVWVRSTSREIL